MLHVVFVRATKLEPSTAFAGHKGDKYMSNLIFSHWHYRKARRCSYICVCGNTLQGDKYMSKEKAKGDKYMKSKVRA